MGGGTGVAIVEVFEVDEPGTPLINIATRARVQAGDNVLIAARCQFIPANHRTTSTEIPINTQGLELGPIEIGDDVWIGAGVVVVAGVKIGRGAVIGAGSVVTRDVAPHAVAMGVPARVKKMRRGDSAS